MIPPVRFVRDVAAAVWLLRVCALAAALLVAAPVSAAADTIRIELLSRVTEGDGRIHVALTIANRGDATAHRVETSVEFHGQVVAGDVLATLAAGEQQQLSFDVPVLGSNPRGRWPLVVRARHADANNHPFEAIHIDTVDLGGALNDGGLRAHIDDVRVETEASTEVRVSPGRMVAGVRVALVAPLGLSMNAPPTAAVATGGGESSVPITVRNISATPTSRLPVFVIVEGDDADGGHHTAIAGAFVDVGPAPERARLWIAAGFVCAIVVALFVLLRRRRTTAV